MSRLLLRKVALGSVLALALISALIAVPFVSAHISAANQSATGRWTIHGHLVPAVRHLTPQAIADSAQALDLSIGLSLRDQSGLTRLIAAQNDPHAALYHHFLTPREFAARFSPSPATVTRITTWLRAQGLVVHRVSSNRTLISASGSVAAVEQAFQTTIATYQLHGRTVYAPTVEPSVPGALSGLIVSIAGLNDVGLRTHGPSRPSRSRTIRPRVGSGPGGGYTPSELHTAYNMNWLLGNANGSGQTVAIFELDGYQASDVNAYLSYYGLGSAKYSDVLVDGATNTAGPGAIEVELDMEVVSAIAPGATQKIYIGPNTDIGVNDTYNQIVTDDIAKVTSTSWGLCEAFSGTSELQTLDNIFAQGAAQGQAFFAASGDAGAYDCGDTNLGVDSPADDPNVVGVGGTHMVIVSGFPNLSESVWSNRSDTSNFPNGAGSGGGVSTYFARPSYQTGPGTTNTYSNGKREVPDVAADADPNTGYSVYCTASASGCPVSGWIEVGGTSAGAPLWAGIALDVNQYLAAHGAPVLGSASATLYTLFNTAQTYTYTPYYDVTSGDNLFYRATASYDLATGIGSPDAYAIAHDLAPNDFSLSASPPGLTYYQSINAGSIGTMIKTVRTSGLGGTINLSASVSPAGPSVSLASSSITAGNSTWMNVSFPGNTALGVYMITVTGTEGSTTHSITVAVTVAQPPTDDFSISANPDSLTMPQGTSATATISTAVTWGNTGYILNLTTSVSPAGPIVSLSPINGVYYVGDSTILTVHVDSEVAPGNYTITVTADGWTGSTNVTHSTTVTITVVSNGGDGIVNGGFETGDLSGWTTSGATSIVSINSTGTGGPPYVAQIGSASPYRGDSSISQTFTATSGYGLLTFEYHIWCPDSVNFDWATATLKDNTLGVTSTILGRTCVSTGTLASARVTAGHSYTLTITAHDDNDPHYPTYIQVDNVTLWTPVPQPFINGGFETGTLSGWTPSGATAISATGHSGSYSAQIGSDSPVSGDSTLSQAVSVPAGTTTLSFWYKVVCTDIVSYDWATATLRDNTASTTTTILPHTCTNNGTWVQVTAPVISGHSYTLTLIDHDDGWLGDPTYFLVDDVSVS